MDVSTNKTLAATDCGIIQNVIADGITITLPVTAAGLVFNIRNGGAVSATLPAGAIWDGENAVTVAPNSADQIAGNGFTATDNKAAVNTKATAQVGDYIKLVGDGGAGWVIDSLSGTWARQA